jgi:hypothetical protein
MSDNTDYKRDGPEAQRIASVIPYYPFHGVERFYDISGMLSDPEGTYVCMRGTSITVPHMHDLLTYA